MAIQREVHGVQEKDYVNRSRITRDTRRSLQKSLDWIGRSRKNLGLFIMAWSAFLFFFPAFWLMGSFFFLMMTAAFWEKASYRALPLRLPMGSLGVDYNSPNPGRMSYRKPSGIFFFGNDLDDKELWGNASDVLTHMLVFGTTGSGKTEFLTGLCTNALTNGAGVVMIDPKGTNTLWYKLYLLARIMGRDDDALLINFSTGGKKVEKFTPDRKSNTLNPFTTGTAETLNEILSSFVPVSQGDNAVFSQRAITFMSALMFPLAYLRDQKAINLSVSVIREYMPLDKVMKLAGYPAKEPMYGVMLPDDVIYPLQAYLNSVAGFDKTKPKQTPETSRQHDFSQAYYTRPLASLEDTYGFIYGAELGEINYRDVVYNRRILCILLPAMEKSAAELKQTSGLILQGIKGAISLGLGDKYEGSVESSLLTLPSAARVPTLMIADEYGYVATEGFAVIPAQARGLGFAFVFAGQDYAGFKRGSETEAEQIVANTKIKVLMTLEDPQTTYTLFKELAGMVTVTRVNNYETDEENPMGKDFKDGASVSVQEVSPIDIRDLKAQIEGEFHMFYRDSVIRGVSFHAALEPEKMPGFTIKILRGLEVKRPSLEKISRKYGKLQVIKESISELMKKQVAPDVPPLKSNPPFHLTKWTEFLGASFDERTVMDAWYQTLKETIQQIAPVDSVASVAPVVDNASDVDEHEDVTKDKTSAELNLKESLSDEPALDDDDHVLNDEVLFGEGSDFGDSLDDDLPDVMMDEPFLGAPKAKNTDALLNDSSTHDATSAINAKTTELSSKALKEHLVKAINAYPSTPKPKPDSDVVRNLFAELINQDKDKNKK